MVIIPPTPRHAGEAEQRVEVAAGDTSDDEEAQRVEAEHTIVSLRAELEVEKKKTEENMLQMKELCKYKMQANEQEDTIAALHRERKDMNTRMEAAEGRHAEDMLKMQTKAVETVDTIKKMLAKERERSALVKTRSAAEVKRVRDKAATDIQDFQNKLSSSGAETRKAQEALQRAADKISAHEGEVLRLTNLMKEQAAETRRQRNELLSQMQQESSRPFSN